MPAQTPLRFSSTATAKQVVIKTIHRCEKRTSRRRQKQHSHHFLFFSSSSNRHKDTDKEISLWDYLRNIKNKYLDSGYARHTTSKRTITHPPRQPPPVADVPASSKRHATHHDRRPLPQWITPWEKEFSHTSSDHVSRQEWWESSRRIARIALDGALEPSAVALLTVSTTAVLSIGAVEGWLLCNDVNLQFVLQYSLHQLLPSCVWSTQDATVIATAMGLDPKILLQNLDPSIPADAQTILQVQFLEASRSMAAGFMLLAQLVRVGSIGAHAPTVYKERIKMGREPPMLRTPTIVRLCGRDSDVTATSLRRMGRHLIPVYEEPDRVTHLVQHKRYPVYWWIRPLFYGNSYWWRDFPVDECCFLKSATTGENVLLLEADATNPDDPLALGDHALDLTIDDASQGFRRIEELYRTNRNMPNFRIQRVFLGNSLEVYKSGGGHAYTLRHRVRFAKEVDVLMDSRAPVLQEILSWCHTVAGANGRKIMFQTSSRQYFLNLRLLMRKYGFEIYDPLDWRMLDELEASSSEILAYSSEDEDDPDASTKAAQKYESLLQVLLDDTVFMDSYSSEGKVDVAAEPKSCGNDDKTRKQRIREIAKHSRLPRLVYYGTTAETVNAVQALVNAGQVEVSKCCALLDKEEGMTFLTKGLDEQLKRDRREQQAAGLTWKSESSDSVPTNNGGGLHIVCSATIYDDLFRQVRQWTRMGYTAEEIQTELDIRFEDTLQHTREVKETIVEKSTEEEEEEEVEQNKDPFAEKVPSLSDAEIIVDSGDPKPPT